MKKWLLSIFLLLVLVIFGKEVKIVFLEFYTKKLTINF